MRFSPWSSTRRGAAIGSDAQTRGHIIPYRREALTAYTYTERHTGLPSYPYWLACSLRTDSRPLATNASHSRRRLGHHTTHDTTNHDPTRRATARAMTHMSQVQLPLCCCSLFSAVLAGPLRVGDEEQRRAPSPEHVDLCFASLRTHSTGIGTCQYTRHASR